MWPTFVTESVTPAFQVDSLLSTHPISADVNKPSEISSIFDVISYEKSASVLRCLDAFLSRRVFVSGLMSYFKEFQYSSANPEDLWRHLSLASSIDVGCMVKCWMEDKGYPLIRVHDSTFDVNKKSLTIRLSQQRFCASHGYSHVVWHIPLFLATHKGALATDFVMTEAEQSFTFPYEECADSFYKINHQTKSFCRVWRTPEQNIKILRLSTDATDRISGNQPIL